MDFKYDDKVICIGEDDGYVQTVAKTGRIKFIGWA